MFRWASTRFAKHSDGLLAPHVGHSLAKAICLFTRHIQALLRNLLEMQSRVAEHGQSMLVAAQEASKREAILCAGSCRLSFGGCSLC